MLFQGQEWCSTKPFLFFADLSDDLKGPVAKGRRKFLSQFPSLEGIELALPHSADTFANSKLDWAERDQNPQWLRLHRDLSALKKNDAVLNKEGAHGLDTATLTEEAFLIRHRSPDGDDRLLIVNLGTDLSPRIVPEPLLAPPDVRSWHQIWSSEDPRYGGRGIRASENKDGVWHFPGHAAVLLAAIQNHIPEIGKQP
jgi:maltooligosyltrehalose trehalohydrolase